MSNAFATVEAYDPVTDTWSTMDPMPTARAYPVSAVINGQLYVAGGFDLVGGVPVGVSTLEVFTPPSPVVDTDSDGIPDAEDNCPSIYNPDQADFDSDGLGDVCDPDDDNDGVLDVDDSCPFEDATGFDADSDGCIDTVVGLQQTIVTLPDDVLSDEIKNSLASKVDNALNSVDKEKDNAAISMLEAFINQVEAQRGKKISEEVADMLIAMANNVIAQI